MTCDEIGNNSPFTVRNGSDTVCMPAKNPDSPNERNRIMIQQPTLRERLKYRFDNFMAKGFGALMLALGAASGLVIVVAALVLVMTGAAPEGESALPFIEAAWQSLMRTLDAGTMGGDKGWAFRIIMFGVTLGGIMVISTFIGLISGAIEEKVEELRRGRSRVLESGHFVILGWGPGVFTIIRELITALQPEDHSCILVVSPTDKVEMEEEIAKRIEDPGNTMVICRNGDPVDPDDLEIASLDTSRAIVVLAPESDNPDPDVIKSLLAITQRKGRRSEPYHIVAEIRETKNVEAARYISPKEIEVVQTADVLARIIAQTCRTSGLSLVYSELLGFDGDEIYFKEIPAMVGKSFAESLLQFSDSCVIGLLPKGKTPQMNPPMDTIIGAGDMIIAITKDSTSLKPITGKLPDVVAPSPDLSKPQVPTAEHTLIIGFNWRVPAVIQQLDEYVAEGSTIVVLSTFEKAAESISAQCAKLKKAKVEVKVADTTDRAVLEEALGQKLNRVILMGYTDEMPLQQADSLTLITLLHLRVIQEKLGRKLGVVTEMLDQRNRVLADVAHADDYIVSNHLVSMLLAQVAFKKEVHPIFVDIFDPEGSEIYLKLASRYCKIGQPIDFYSIVESARKKGEIAIGYRIKEQAFDAEKNYGIVINPEKSIRTTFSEWDRIIVIAEDEIGR